MDKMIEGVALHPLKQFIDERGKVLHMLRSDSSLFKQFGEIYFSVVNPSVIKGWKQHFYKEQNLCVPVGQVKFVLYDNRENSSTYKKINEIYLGESEKEYALLQIPPYIWYAFQGISTVPALIANCSTHFHSQGEGEVANINSSLIPYNWN